MVRAIKVKDRGYGIGQVTSSTAVALMPQEKQSITVEAHRLMALAVRRRRNNLIPVSHGTGRAGVNIIVKGRILEIHYGAEPLSGGFLVTSRH